MLCNTPTCNHQNAHIMIFHDAFSWIFVFFNSADITVRFALIRLYMHAHQARQSQTCCSGVNILNSSKGILQTLYFVMKYFAVTQSKCLLLAAINSNCVRKNKLMEFFFFFVSNLDPVQIVTVNLYREADLKKKKKDKNTKIGMIKQPSYNRARGDICCQNTDLSD